MAKLSLTLRVRGEVRANSTHKVWLRVTQRGKTMYVDTCVVVGVSIHGNAFVPNFENGAITSNDAGFVEKNVDLKRFMVKAQNVVNRLYNLEIITAERLRDIIKKDCAHVYTYDGMANEYGQMKNDNYRKRIELSVRYWNNFTNDHVGEVVRLDAISPELLNNYSLWLKTMRKESGAVVSESYVQGVLSIMKAVINWAIRMGHVNYAVHPFALTKIGKTHRDRCDIEPEDVRRLMNAIFPANKLKWSRARDMWFLSLYMGGMNLKDMMAADWSGESVRFVRSKTRNKVADEFVIYILPEAREIVDRWMGEDGRLQLGLSVDAIHNVGRALREIGKAYGLPERFKFMSARHTFAQFCMNMGVPDSITNYLMAHADGRGVIGYYNGVAPRIAKKFLCKIVDYMRDPDRYEDAMVDALFRIAR